MQDPLDVGCPMEEPQGMDVDMINYHVETNIDEIAEQADAQGLLDILERALKPEVKNDDDAILTIIMGIGGDTRKYKRERKRAINRIVAEVYSPPRVTAAAKRLPELKIVPGFALDLSTADSDGRMWDFDDQEMGNGAMRKLKIERPPLLVG